jgi:hypothetical protein
VDFASEKDGTTYCELGALSLEILRNNRQFWGLICLIYALPQELQSMVSTSCSATDDNEDNRYDFYLVLMENPRRSQ